MCACRNSGPRNCSRGSSSIGEIERKFRRTMENTPVTRTATLSGAPEEFRRDRVAFGIASPPRELRRCSKMIRENVCRRGNHQDRSATSKDRRTSHSPPLSFPPCCRTHGLINDDAARADFIRRREGERQRGKKILCVSLAFYQLHTGTRTCGSGTHRNFLSLLDTAGHVIRDT